MNLHEYQARALLRAAGVPMPDGDVAGSPAEARVRAVALACQKGQLRELSALARSPAHRRTLEGTADALWVAYRRSSERGFGPHDGRLTDGAAIRRIAEDFGPRRPAFSPSECSRSS